MPWDDEQAQEQVEHAEALLSELAERPDGDLGAATVRTLIALYGDCLARVLRALERGGHAELTEELIQDVLVEHLLLAHDLHPVDLGTRVSRAVGDVAQRESVDLLEVTGDVVRVRVNTSGCQATMRRVRDTLEQVLAERAPEVGLRIEQHAPAPVIPTEALFSQGRAMEGR